MDILYYTFLDRTHTSFHLPFFYYFYMHGFHIGKPIADGYFVLSNLCIKVQESYYNGMAFKLVDGLVVTGNSQIIHHGTTSSKFNGSIFGIQFAANGISVSS